MSVANRERSSLLPVQLFSSNSCRAENQAFSIRQFIDDEIISYILALALNNKKATNRSKRLCQDTIFQVRKNLHQIQ